MDKIFTVSIIGQPAPRMQSKIVWKGIVRAESRKQAIEKVKQYIANDGWFNYYPKRVGEIKAYEIEDDIYVYQTR